MQVTLNEVISRLSHFWLEQRCVQLLPCGLELATASAHPDVFFPLFGPHPWRAFCLQTLHRPLDGRDTQIPRSLDGQSRQHTHRLARHLQLHVLLKPSPDNVPALFLASLEAADYPLRDHDVRFVARTWEMSSLAARGLGWRVLVNGLSIARLSLLQEAAGQELAPPALEIVYGLERLALAAGSAADVFEVLAADSDQLQPEAMRRREEVELTTYAREVADAVFLRRHVEALLEEARSCLEARLSRPAYELAVQSLHAVDLLVARGEFGFHEREAHLGRVQQLTRAAAALALQVDAGRATGDRDG